MFISQYVFSSIFLLTSVTVCTLSKRRRRYFVFWLSVRQRTYSTKSLLTRYLINRSCEFHQIYNFGAVWHKVKVRMITNGQTNTWEDIFSPVSWMNGLTLMKLSTITHCQVRIILLIFSRSWIQRSRLQISFSENALSLGGRRSTVCHRIPSSSLLTDLLTYWCTISWLSGN